MVSFYDKLRGATSQPLPIVAKLEGVFRALDDTELLAALKGKVHRGCQGYPVEALWHSYLAAYVLNIPTVASLIRTLESHPSLCEVCGVSPSAIPSEATYSRFISKLTKYQGLVERVMKDGVDNLRASIPDFGRIVGIDSTDLTAYSQSRKPSDPDARWAKKRNKHGRDHWWFGFKIHVVADAVHELPIHIEVTSANVSDSPALIPVLERSGVHPDFVLADAGYDAGANYTYVRKNLGAVPIIKLNKRGRREDGQGAHRSKEWHQGQEFRNNPGIDRSSPEWDAKYALRVGVERLIGRSKEFRRLGSVHHRGLPKVTLHAYLSVLTVVASALAAVLEGSSLRQVA